MAAAAGLPIDPATIARVAHVTGSLQVAPHQAVVALDDREPGMRRRIVVPLEQSLRSFDPASDRGHQRGIHQKVQSDPSRRVSRRQRVPGAHRLGVRAFPRLDRDVEMTCRVGDLAQQPELVNAKSGVLVRADEQAERPRPITGGGRIASLLHQLRFGHAVHRSPICRHYRSPR